MDIGTPPDDSGFPIRPGLVIPRNEVWFEFSHASGPGGQNVNKVSTAVTLCFHPRASRVLADAHKALVERALANRINADGILKITAEDGRSQSGNRARASLRFRQLLSKALLVAKKRTPTRPSKASRERRLADKRIRAARKSNRRPDPEADM